MALPQILLVEDESIVAPDLTPRLTRWGYAVTRVASGAAAMVAADTRRPGLVVVDVHQSGAIERALAGRPHLVLMDIHLHGTMDGIDAARHIQAAAPIPVVYMSSHANAATIERFQATTRAVGFVPKLIHLPTLHGHPAACVLPSTR